MRLHAIALALFIIGAHSASIPDKKDIEKKLTAVVKEVLNKDEVPVDNVSSAQELTESVDGAKNVENNLRKSTQPANIPVKVVVEDVQPTLKSNDKKEDNEVTPASEESSEIVREEIDLKNPGPPQRMQHDTQNPEHFEDAQQAIVLKNSQWRSSTQYAAVQKDIKELKETFENKMTELFESLQDHIKTHSEDEKKDEIVKVRTSVRQDSSSSSSSSSSSGGGGSSNSNSTNQWGGPFGGFFQNWATQFQQNLQNLNQTVNNYWQNNTNSNSTSSNNCNSGSTPAIFNWGNNNPLNFGQQQGQGQQGQQSDEPARPGLWQTAVQNVQSFLSGNQPPAAAQSDSQQPAQPNRPVIQAFQNAFQQAGSLFQRPSENQPQQPSQTTSEEGTNAVPAENKPEKPGKEKPEQTSPPQPQQNGPIKQITAQIGSNPVVQGIAGAVQRIQHAIVPTKPRDEPIKESGEKDNKGTKGVIALPLKPPVRPLTGDNNDVNSSGVDSKIVPGVVPQKEAPEPPTTEDEKVPDDKDKTE